MRLRDIWSVTPPIHAIATVLPHFLSRIEILIAFTGLSLVGFLVAHLAGNLLFFVWPDAFNHYGDVLIKNPLVIPAELGLIAFFLLHIYKAVRMFVAANGARPVDYAKKEWAGHTSRKSLASTTMILSGLFLLLFVPFHVKTFKYGAYYESPSPAFATCGAWSRRSSAIRATSSSTSSAWRIIGFHLWHGVSSALQSLGIDQPGWYAGAAPDRVDRRPSSWPWASSASRSTSTSSGARS